MASRRRQGSDGAAVLLLLLILALLAVGAWVLMTGDVAWGPAGGAQ